ncbi:MAG: hypothetical protein ACRENN_02985 [Candidatus Eiseniibacteriota bacterium]
MNATKTFKRWMVILGLLSAAIVLGAPSTARADQGKWWTPRKGGQAVRVRESYRAPVWHSTRYVRPAPRYYRPWNGDRIYRDHAWVGGSSSYRRSVYGWRYYSAPVFYYPHHVVYVRPIRFFVSADAVIGGVRVHAGVADPGPVYGCNFCDAQFHSFHSYEAHVARCPDAPRGYQVVPRDWESSQWDSQGPHDQDNWHADDQD